MNRVPRPKVSRSLTVCLLALAPIAVRAQTPMSSTYATRDGRVPASVLGCASTDGSVLALPCGVAGYPLHVQVDGGASGTTAPGAAPGQVTSVQGGGAGALPVAVSQSGTWTLALPGGSHLALDAGGNVIGGVVQSGAWSVAVSNLPATQAVSAAALPLPAGAATAANQPTRNADGGSQVHIMNLPSTQPVSAAALPLPAGAATAANQPALNGDGGALVHLTNPTASQTVTGSVSVSNLPATQAVSGTVSVGNLPATQAISATALPLPAGAATAASQPALNSDGGALVHVTNPTTSQTVTGSVSVSNLPATQAVSGTISVGNLPATQAISAAALPLPAGAALAANQPAINPDGGSQVHLVNALPTGANTIGTVVEANRSGAWTDASFTATATASSPAGLASVAARTGLHLWNLGAATACLNYTATAVASGGGCAAGSVPIPAGSAYLEDQPGNVSPEAISLVCAAASCPLTIKVR